MHMTQMEREAQSIPNLIEQQFEKNYYAIQDLCARLQCYPPKFAMTIARGSSDHAATFAKYLLETQLGLVTASAAPSVITLYKAKLNLKNSLVIGFSQSGQSPDIAESIITARQAGAITVAIVNQIDSPVADAAEYVIPLHAGPELAVAATKSYLTMLATMIHFVALFKQEKRLFDSLKLLPNRLLEASRKDWSQAIDEFLHSQNIFVVGRGYGFPIAQEAALKFKETCRIHAEAFSSAEVLHGPFELVQPHFPILIFGQRDESLPGILKLAKKAKDFQSTVLLAIPNNAVSLIEQKESSTIVLPLPDALHPLCDPLLIVQAFYMMIAKLSVSRGFNPDTPANLSKVTKTW